MISSFISHLRCSGCGKEYSALEIHTFCPDCQSPLLSRYDLKSVRQQVDRAEIPRRQKGMWRWHELLPVMHLEEVVSLGEGDTTLLRAAKLGKELGLTDLFIKEESANPTGSFKARGLAAAVSKAKEFKIQKVILPSADNAGGALAAYAARAEMQAVIYMSKDTPRANIVKSCVAGAKVVLVDGLLSDAAGVAGEKARAEGWFDLSAFKEPYRVEGKKTIGYEIAETLGWTLPDVIICPTGSGAGLVGMWKAFQELAELGWLESTRLPRMVAVQAEGCAPVVKAFEAGVDFCDFWTNACTIASELRIPKSFADSLILRTLYDSRGTAISVSDESILQARIQLSKLEGIFPALGGAATLAGLHTLLERKWVAPDERIVLFNSGSGLKYL